MSEEQKPDQAAAPSGSGSDAAQETAGHAPPPRGPWGWAIVVGGLAILGLLLAIADIALNGPMLGPFADALIGRSVVTTTVPLRTPDPQRFNRARFPERITFVAPFGRLGPISAVQALRDVLSNGAGLIFLALGALLLFPNRARIAVKHLERRHGPEIALAAGVAAFLLALAAITLLRFTLLFIAVIPVVLVVALAAVLFGVACIALTIGRLMQRVLNLGPAHPLVAALAGALVVFDLAVIPYVGIVAMALVAIGALGLAIVTRFGSETGWLFADLNW